jgi:hypothetical protein
MSCLFKGVIEEGKMQSNQVFALTRGVCVYFHIDNLVNVPPPQGKLVEFSLEKKFQFFLVRKSTKF